jgi:hypothetical protein
MSTDSALDDLRLGIRLPESPTLPTIVRLTSLHGRQPVATTIAPSLSLGATTTKALSFGPLGTPARLTSGASLARSPPVWADDTRGVTPSLTLSLGAEQIPPSRRDLHNALVHASCRSATWGELAPPSLGRHPCAVSAWL